MKKLCARLAMVAIVVVSLAGYYAARHSLEARDRASSKTTAPPQRTVASQSTESAKTKAPAGGEVRDPSCNASVVRLFNANADDEVVTVLANGGPLIGHTNYATSVAFAPDGLTLASTSYDHTVRLWDASTGAKKGSPLVGHSDTVWSVAYSPDGALIATGSSDRTLRLWDAATGVAVGAPMVGHSGIVYSIAFSFDGRTLASGGNDGTLRLWDVAAAAKGSSVGTILARPGGEIVCIALSPDSRTLVAGSADGTVRLWNVATGSAIGVAAMRAAATVRGVAFSPDGSIIAGGSWDNTVRLWDARTGAPKRTPLTGHRTGGANSVAFSPDGRTLASAGGDFTVRLWDVDTGAALGVPLLGHNYWVHGVAFSPDGRTLASAACDNLVFLWDVRRVASGDITIDGKEVDQVCGVTTSNLGARTTSTVCTTRNVSLWNAAATTAARACSNESQLISATLAVTEATTTASPDLLPQSVTLSVWDQTVRLWDVVDMCVGVAAAVVFAALACDVMWSHQMDELRQRLADAEMRVCQVRQQQLFTDPAEAKVNGPSSNATTTTTHACIVCLERPRDIYFSPCGHVCVCHVCALRMDKCAMCRAHVDAGLPAFIS